MKATHLNVGSLADLVTLASESITKNADGSFTVSNGFPRVGVVAPSAAHLRRCIKTGLLVVESPERLLVTVEGWHQVCAYMRSYLRTLQWRITEEPKGSYDATLKAHLVKMAITLEILTSK